MPAPTAEGPPARLPTGYEFVRVLGSGGNGWVALARQSVLDRLVAVKTIYGGHHDIPARKRLEREGQALARLSHPRLVRVYELLDSAEDLMLVMEFVDGMDLAQAAPSLDGSARLQVLADVAAALEHAAANGVVHRDVKPPNVLLDLDGRAKLTDFGIARVSRSAAAFRTGASAASGTPRYVAPEQLTDPDHEAPTADAYSFAVMAYELVVGQPPFRATSPEGLIYAHMSLAPTPPQQASPGLDDQSAQALLAGLSKHPAERPTPTQLVAALAAGAGGWVPLSPVSDAGRRSGTGGGPIPPPATGPVVPWTDPSVFTPPPVSMLRRIPPFVIGAVLALIVVVIYLVLVR